MRKSYINLKYVCKYVPGDICQYKFLFSCQEKTSQGVGKTMGENKGVAAFGVNIPGWMGNVG